VLAAILERGGGVRSLFYLLSRFGALVYLMRHPRVPRWLKAIPVLALLYVIWPRDLLLDFLPPPVGVFDDFIVVLVLTNLFLWFASKYAQRPPLPKDDGRTVQVNFRVLGDPPPEGGEPLPGCDSDDEPNPKRRR
jgi:uncharacterized membrane protein YkvA (DUF1232 family)